MGNEKRNLIEDIINNYDIEEQLVVEQLNFVNHHGPTLGTFREEIWQDLFAKIIPKKFSIERSVFLIDSKGRTSSEVDLAIFDEMYTPYIFRKGKIKYIPIEAVAVAIQCKSTDFGGISDWAKSIKKLKTTGNSIARMATTVCVEPPKTQSSTRPIMILCSISKPSKENAELFDFIIHKAKGNSARLVVEIPNDNRSLFDWYLTLNHYNESSKNQIDDTDAKAESVNPNNMQEKKEEKIEAAISNIRNALEQTEYKYIDDKIAAINTCFDSIHKDLNELKLEDNYSIHSDNHNTSLLTLNFQLNQLLMLINNPMLFPHQAYVEMFNKISKEKIDGNDTENKT